VEVVDGPRTSSLNELNELDALDNQNGYGGFVDYLEDANFDRRQSRAGRDSEAEKARSRGASEYQRANFRAMHTAQKSMAPNVQSSFIMTPPKEMTSSYA
jgi:hypothetical protein